MTPLGIIQIAFYFLVLLALTKPLGIYMARVFQGQRTFLHRASPLELCSVHRSERTANNTRPNTASVLAPGVVCFRSPTAPAAAGLPFNPQGYGGRRPLPIYRSTPPSASPNTNWQVYGGEATPATCADGGLTAELPFRGGGHRVAIALIRGFARQSQFIGSFCRYRGDLYVLCSGTGLHCSRRPGSRPEL
jgi:K+-transporting ATPase ATPase A chain